MTQSPRNNWILVVCASACLLAAACSKDDAAGAKAAGSAMGFLPKSAKIVVGVNLAKIRSSKYYKEYKPMLDKAMASDGDFKKLKETCDIDFVNEVKQITLSMEKQNDEKSMWVVVTGLKRSAISDCVDKLKAKGEKVSKKDEGDITAYTIKGDTMYVWWPAESTLVTGAAAEGSADALKALSKGDKLSDNKDLMAMVKKTSTGSMVWFAGGIPEDLPMDAGGMPGGKPEGLFISMDLPDDLEAKLGLHYKDEDTAKKAKKGIKGALDEGKSGLAGAFLKDVSVERSGKDVKISIKLDASSVKMLKSLVGSRLPF